MTTRNRGKESNDDKLFASKWLPVFKEAIDDFCHLLSRGYANNSVLQIVGNRYKLNKRQRQAVLRISSSDEEVAGRKTSHCKAKNLKGKEIEIDGFNLLILLESAMSGAYIFKGRDGTLRDIASVHGSYKRVQKTEQAIILVGQVLKDLEVVTVKWYLDQPVSNSGRLKTRLMEISRDHDFDWEVELVFDPDKVLAISNKVVVSSDGWILDHAAQWFNLGALIIAQHITEANLLEV